jgi:hypothetical protein
VKNQLYEQQKKKKATSEEMTFILDRYVNRWQQWVEHRSRWVLLYDSHAQLANEWLLSFIPQAHWIAVLCYIS